MTILKKPIHWIQFTLLAIFAAALWPLRKIARRRALFGNGWVELRISGEITEFRKEERLQEVILRRFTQQAEPRRLVLERLELLVDELIADPYAKGALVRLGAVTGGWATADSVRKLLLKLRESGCQVIIHIERSAGNRECLIASAGSQVLMPPTGMLAAGGAAAPGLYFKNLLDKLGLTAEVASAGRFKSAPDQFTRADRSEADRTQTKAIVDALDNALIKAMQSSGRHDEAEARSLLGEAPAVGIRAKELNWVDGLAADEDLNSVIPNYDTKATTKDPVPANRYLALRTITKPFEPKHRHIGIVRIVGNILDEGPPQGLSSSEAAIERRVVTDIRSALRDPQIAAVVLHINSRGGSVTASDSIWSAVKRLDKEKPVIAYLSDVAASGGYYIACGARSIVCSPLTVTGSIGVFSVIPTWPELTKKLGIGQDVIKNLSNADIYNPWSGFDDARRAHSQREVEIMYEVFLEKVAEARKMSRDEADAVAQGRVWMGSDAMNAGLVDGLGGLNEALERARQLVRDEVLAPTPKLVRSRRPQKRPSPVQTEGAISPADFLLNLVKPDERILAQEILTLWATRTPHSAPAWAWSPVHFT